MSGEEFKVQWSVSLPPAAQYAKGDMLNIRGASVEEVGVLFDEILASEFIEKATDVANLLRAAAVVSAPDAPASDPTPAPANTESSSPSVLRVCPHGKRVRREGTNAKGGWVGWFCPTPKGTADQCKPDWED